MYNLDINFLKERQPKTVASEDAVKSPASTQSKVPLIAGLVAMVVFPGISFGFLLGTKAQKTALEEELQQMDAELVTAQQRQQRLDAIRAEIAEAQSQNQALASVIEQIKPWSAILTEVGAQIPPGVQINSIFQGENGGLALTIEGEADSYSDVNDFVLVLQQSPFINGEATRLISAALEDSSMDLKLPGEVQGDEDVDIPDEIKNAANAEQEARISLDLPEVVNYTIATEISDVPASELLQLLDSRGAIGLVTRIATLKQQGAIE